MSAKEMREIKFKAKRKYNNKWVYGYIFKDINKTAQMLFNSKNGDIEFVDILPKTICEYTGLKDKNDVEIYENDIVCIDAYSYDEPEFDGDFKVKYDIMVGCWFFVNVDDEDDFYTIEELRNFYRLDIKTIGNVWDKEVK